MKHLLTLTLTATLVLPIYAGTYYSTVRTFKCGMSPPDSPCYPYYRVFGQFGNYVFAPIHQLDRRARSENWNVIPQDQLQSEQ